MPVVVHTFHGNVFSGYFSPRKTKLFISIEKNLARSTDAIIVLSEQQRAEILNLGIGKASQYRVIPLGLDLNPFLHSENLRGDLRRELQISESVPIIGIVARLVPIKAIHLLLEAAAQVVKTHPNAVFLIVGDGEMRGALEQQTQKLNLSKNVRFLGFRSDLPRLYADFDVSVLVFAKRRFAGGRYRIVSLRAACSGNKCRRRGRFNRASENRLAVRAAECGGIGRRYPLCA